MEFTLRPSRPKRCRARLPRPNDIGAQRPAEAESICLDALEIEPENHDALVTLLLALTEQFEEDVPMAVSEASRSSIAQRSVRARLLLGMCGSGAPRHSSTAAG